MENNIGKWSILFWLVGIVCSSNSSFSPVISTQSCPSAAMRETLHQEIQDQVESILQDRVVPSLRSRPPCACGGPGEWTRIAYLNMSDPSQQCPPNWNLISTVTVRGCGRSSTVGQSCDSAIFPSNGKSYSQVCGRATAIQVGSPDAFGFNGDFINELEGAYLDGISITHGSTGSRQHIWSFAAALAENFQSPREICSCTRSDASWPHQVPTFIEDRYFCATGNPGPGFSTTVVYDDDPLWDGEGCGPTNACCEFNNPPWFCTTLPQPTTDNLEVRICFDSGPGDEDIYVTLIDIYIK